MSRSGLVHEIRAEFEGLESRSDLSDHRVLYVLDLDCDYAVPLLRAVRVTASLFTVSKISYERHKRTEIYTSHFLIIAACLRNFTITTIA